MDIARHESGRTLAVSGHTLVLGFGRVLLGFLFATLIVVSARHALNAGPGYLDLDSFLHAGASFQRGLNPYAENPAVLPAPLKNSPNLNPPISAYVFAPLTALEPSAVRAVFFVGSLALFAGLILVLTWQFPEHRRPVSILAICALGGLWYTLEFNQIYVPLVAATTGAWLRLRRDEGSLIAGVLIGLVTAIKPQFGVLAAVLFVAGYRRPAISALATALLVSLVPLVLAGQRIYDQWLTAVRGFEGYLWPGNASLTAVGGRLGLDWLGYALVAVVLAGLLVWARRTRPNAATACTAGIVAVVLTGPTSWPGYMLFFSCRSC